MSYAQDGVIELRFLPWNRKMEDGALAPTRIAKARFPTSHVKEQIDERQRSRGVKRARVVGKSVPSRR
jgi:hypothetical protein